jgi:hypothetical protein
MSVRLTEPRAGAVALPEQLRVLSHRGRRQPPNHALEPTADHASIPAHELSGPPSPRSGGGSALIR